MTWGVAFGFIRNGVMSIQTLFGHSFYEFPVLYIEYAKWVASLALKNQPVPFKESMLQILAYNKHYPDYTIKLMNCCTCDFHVTAKHEQRLEYVIDDMHHPAIFVDRNKMANDYYKTHLNYYGVFLSIVLLNYDTGCFEYYRANDMELIYTVLSNIPEHDTMESKYSSEVLNTPQYVSIPFSELENIKPNYDAISSYQHVQRYPELM